MEARSSCIIFGILLVVFHNAPFFFMLMMTVGGVLYTLGSFVYEEVTTDNDDENLVRMEMKNEKK